MTDIAATLACLLMGGIFVFAGVDHFRNFAAVKAMVASHGWPAAGPLLAGVSAFQIATGLCLALGPLRPWAALGLAAFTVAASLSFLAFWRAEGTDRMWMRSEFIVNVGLVGGLLLAFAVGL
ncbi:DoxX family protein [Amaricoccus sp. W119]|jgi:putative oxidoreductase|uniref:DoxX family protein n=1 Tax=Amaricoccus sp. W119 TaxID=3391833 RepID=UPI0039A4D105